MKPWIPSLLFFLVAATGCSVLKGNADAFGTASGDSLAANFSRNGSLIKVIYDKNGEWVSIEAQATAPVSADSTVAREQALVVATLRARRNIAEFMHIDLRSSRSVETISKSLQKATGTKPPFASASLDEETGKSASSDGGTVPGHEATYRVAERVRETIVQSSSAILRGLTVVEQSFDAEFQWVRVGLVADRNSLRAAERIGQAMQSKR